MESAELTAAIDGLYDAFAGYARPATFLACGCCFEGVEVPDAHWLSTLRPLVEVVAPGGDRPLREVDADTALADIGTSVPFTGGDLALLKHYLPRLLEITATTGFEHDDPPLWTITGHLSATVGLGRELWWNWPEAEQRAVQVFLEAAWTTARRGTAAETDDGLGAIARAVPRIRPYLDAWVADRDEIAAANLMAFTDEMQTALAERDKTAFWWSTDGDEPSTTNYADLVDWLNARPPT